MEKRYKVKIVTLQEKLKEKDAILTTLAQINKDLLKATEMILDYMGSPNLEEEHNTKF